ILGIASGLEYLHRHGIVHSNLQVVRIERCHGKHGTPCICDFGISRIVNCRGFTTSSIRIAKYMAPELFLVLTEFSDDTQEIPNETQDRAFDRRSRTTSMSSDVYSFALLVLDIRLDLSVQWSNSLIRL
ncbi:kinase-like domain-containing protein, partial [Mycena albidolilacea]